MHNAPLSFLIYLPCFKNSYVLNRRELEPCVYDVFDSESTLELNPELVTLTPGTSRIYTSVRPGRHNLSFNCMVKVKVNFVLEQAMMAQRGSKSIAQLFL
jgi:hypothetical protein